MLWREKSSWRSPLAVTVSTEKVVGRDMHSLWRSHGVLTSSLGQSRSWLVMFMHLFSLWQIYWHGPFVIMAALLFLNSKVSINRFVYYWFCYSENISNTYIAIMYFHFSKKKKGLRLHGKMQGWKDVMVLAIVWVLRVCCE